MSKGTRTSTAKIMTVNEMIVAAFGDEDNNIISFKLVQAILLVLANQLRLLQRQVAIEFDPPIRSSNNSLMINEFKIGAYRKQKKILKGETVESRSSSAYETHPKLHDSRSLTKEYLHRKQEKTESDQSFINKSAERSPMRSSEGSSNPEGASHHDVMVVGKNDSGKYDVSTTSKRLHKVKSVDGTSSTQDEQENILKRLPSVDSEIHIEKLKYLDLMEKIEEQREQLLRVIHQRKNSRDEGVTSPSPIASMKASELQYEKLIVVERISDGNMKSKRVSNLSQPLCIITQEKFNALTKLVVELQKRFDASDFASPTFPANSELMQAIRKGSASLTNAMTALQLSARLEATEKALEKVMSLVTDLAKKTPGFEDITNPLECKVDQLTSGLDQQQKNVKQEVHSTEPKNKQEPLVEPNVSTKEQTDTDISQNLIETLNHSNDLAMEAMKKSKQLEKKLNAVMNISKRIMDVENMVKAYTEQLNTIDSVLTSQMANYQDQLTQMQFDIESSIENMTEAIARQGIDPELVLQLNSNFANLLTEIDKTNLVQKDSNFVQKKFSGELSALRKEIELLRDTKCDRDEVVDALRDKAGIKELNGVVTLELHMTTLEDLKQQINQSQHTFYNREKMWQKALDDIFEKIHDKSDKIHVDALRTDINKHLNKFKVQLDNIQKIVGEPLSAGVTRRIFRDTACISCCNVAHPVPADITVPLLPSVRPRPGGEAVMPKPIGDGDQPVCLPGMKILHPMDLKTDMCTRYCGGRRYPPHQVELVRMPNDIHIQQMQTSGTVYTMGSDGKIYKTEMIQRSCVPCNVHHQPQQADVYPEKALASAAGAKTTRNNKDEMKHLKKRSAISNSDPSFRVQLSASFDTTGTNTGIISYNDN